MRPFYRKGIEEGKESFFKVVKNKSLVVADCLIPLAEQSRIPSKKIFDLDKENEKTEYLIFLERTFESSRAEFDLARKQRVEHQKSSVQQDQPNFPIDPKDILKQISELKKNNPDTDIDQ